jgi:hypothetical protein
MGLDVRTRIGSASHEVGMMTAVGAGETATTSGVYQTGALTRGTSRCHQAALGARARLPATLLIRSSGDCDLLA